MKKIFFFTVALVASTMVSAQTTITVDKALGTPSETTQLTEGLYKGADGLAFISDVRSEKGEGFGGLIHEKATKYFKIAGKTVKTEAAVNFQKAPAGIKKNGEMLKTKAPYNRAVEFKPASDGKLYAMVWSKKPQGRLFYGVANNGVYELKEFKTWEKGSTAGSESKPYEALELEYTYTEGDVVFLFASGPLYLSGVYYTGTADAAFEGVMPKELVKAKKTKKAKKAASPKE